MNGAITTRLAGIRQILMAHHAASAELPTAAMGDERETLIREFLEKVFPFPYRFGSGAIADSSGNESGQIDVVVEWPFFASFPAVGGGQRLYLAESVAFVIEVKSNLTKRWNEVEATTKKVRALRRCWSSHVNVDRVAGVIPNPASNSRIPVVAVGFVGDKKPETLAKRLQDTQEDSRPDAALVIESGAYNECGAYNGHPVTDSGEEGLFAFCALGSYWLRNVLIAEPDLLAYVGGNCIPNQGTADSRTLPRTGTGG